MNKILIDKIYCYTYFNFFLSDETDIHNQYSKFVLVTNMKIVEIAIISIMTLSMQKKKIGQVIFNII